MADKKRSHKRKLLGFFLITLAAVALCSAAVLTGRLEEIESRTWDWRLRSIAASTTADPAIKLIIIDQSSLDHFARNDSMYWPWFREVYAAILKYLQRAGARGVAFDILFTEPSSYGVDDDKAFADSFSGTLPVVVGAALRSGSGATAEAAQIAAFKQKQEERLQATQFDSFYLRSSPVQQYASITLPIPELLQASAALGNVAALPDKDGVFRHYSPGGYYQTTPLLGLPFALYDRVLGSQGQRPALGEFFDQRGQLTLRFNGAATGYTAYGVDSIIVSQRQFESGEPALVPESDFKDAWVLIGMNAPGLLDLRPTPLSPVMPGVEYNATVLDNLLHRSFIRRTSAPIDIALSVILAAFAAALCLLPSRGRLQLALLVCLFVAYVYATFVAGHAGYWIPLALPLGAMLISLVSALGFQYQAEGRKRRQVRHAFQHYVSSSVIDQILEDPANLTLGGEKREITVFFCDIAGFTSISESLEASQLGKFLNHFLSEMTEIVLEHGGTVDKYVGDAIIAFWNAPLPVANHAQCAVEAAIRCQEKILELSAALKQEYGVDIKMRIGLSTGVASVGNFGSRRRFNYTAIGDTVNLASRLEGANKYFGTLIMLAHSTHIALAGKIPTRKFAMVRVVGKAEVISVYEPILNSENNAELTQALAAFEKGDLEVAQSLFKSIPTSPVSQAYVKRIQQDLEARKRGEPWSPVWNLVDK